MKDPPSEAKPFARESTGLVRQARWIDSFIFNSSSSWLFGPLIFALTALVWLGESDLISAELVALLFALCIAGMYALLMSLMPRSGGDYVFNSRILHPSIGFAFNFSLTVWQIFSAAFTLYFVANVALSPAIEVLGFFARSSQLYGAGVAIGTPLVSLAIGTAINVAMALVMISGIARTFRMLDVLWGITLAGTLAMILALLFGTSSSFQSSFNQYARLENGTPTVANPYSFVLRSGFSIPFALAIPAIAICASSVIWVFWESYVGGEIRNARNSRRNFSTMGSAAILNGVIFALLVFLLYREVTTPFLIGAMSLPGKLFTSPLQAVATVLVLASGNLYVAIIVIISVTLGYTILLLPALYLQPIRSLFSWGLDGVAPTRMSQVSDKLHSPVIATTIVTAVVEASLLLIFFENALLLPIFYAVIIAPAFSSIFPTALSAITLRRSKTRRFAGQSFRLNLLTTLGVVSAAFILFMTYVFATNPNFFLTGPLLALNFAFIPTGFALYFVSYALRRRMNKINLNLISSEIPPE